MSREEKFSKPNAHRARGLPRLGQLPMRCEMLHRKAAKDEWIDAVQAFVAAQAASRRPAPLHAAITPEPVPPEIPPPSPPPEVPPVVDPPEPGSPAPVRDPPSSPPASVVKRCSRRRR
jgi:hypothetical protein